MRHDVRCELIHAGFDIAVLLAVMEPLSARSCERITAVQEVSVGGALLIHDLGLAVIGEFDISAKVGGPAGAEGLPGALISAQAGAVVPGLGSQITPHRQGQQRPRRLDIDIGDGVADLAGEGVEVGFLGVLAIFRLYLGFGIRHGVAVKSDFAVARASGV